ncbi:MAG: J domain-containing protein [Fluviicola sp.]|nr:J domain-containing protein [Fluviicola sp.]
MPNYYQLLEIDQLATTAEVKKAYRILAKKYHPDMNAEDTTSQFIELEEAYRCLSNSASRKSYDRLLVYQANPDTVRSGAYRKFEQDVAMSNSSARRSGSRHASMNYRQFRRDDILHTSSSAIIIQTVFVLFSGVGVAFLLHAVAVMFYGPYSNKWVDYNGIRLLAVVFPLSLIGLSSLYEPLVRYLIVGKPKSTRKKE